MLIKSIPSSSLFLLILLAAACGKKPAPKGPGPVNVKVQQIIETNAVYYDEYPATVVAINQVELRPQVNGYITGIHFVEGEHVKKGQQLYSIDQQQYEAGYQQSLANVAVQQANLDRAKKDVDRYHELAKHDAVAKQLVDNADATYEAAKKQVDASNATVRSVQTLVRYTTITAPFDGTIGISMVKLGTSVSSGTTILNTVSSDNPIAADISIDQKEIFRFTQLQQAKPGLSDSTFRLTFNGEVYAHPGKILVIDRAVNSQTGTIIIRLQFPNPDNLLRTGMSGTVRVLNNKSQKSMLIPYKAVTEQLGEYFVYVVKVDSNKVSQQRVSLGKQVDRNIVIKTGLKDGDTIVTEGVQNLREGSLIAVKTDDAPKPGAAAQKPSKQ
jgi:membrane fusion protein (multidrug efflux system)